MLLEISARSQVRIWWGGPAPSAGESAGMVGQGTAVSLPLTFSLICDMIEITRLQRVLPLPPHARSFR
jgi:hypothetical protein